jgi:hypothetical protein
MRILLLGLITLITAGCDQPQPSRIPTNSSSQQSTPVNVGNNWNNPTTSPFHSPTPIPGGVVPSGSTQMPGFTNCDLAHRYYAAGIGHMGVCQSNLDEKIIAISSSSASTLRICLIPTYKDQSGSSTYLGRPQCFLPPQDKQVITGSLDRSRTAFSQMPLNAVMVMQESSIEAYYSCMDSYINFPASACPQGPQSSSTCAQLFMNCPNGAQSSNQCHTWAQQQMTTKCQEFKATHSYLDIRLKP